MPRTLGLLVVAAILVAGVGSSTAAVQAASISVAEALDSTGAPPGGSVTVTYSARNDGSDQSPFSLALELGPGWTVGAAPAGCGRPDAWTIDCELPTLAAGATTPTYSVTLTVDANATPGTILNARAFAYPGGTAGATIGGTARSMQVLAPGAPPPPPPAPPTLSVTLAGAGGGTVMSAPGGITCGPYCAANFGFGASITLSATPAAGSRFTGWGGACSGTSPTCSFTIVENTPVSATFDAAPPTTTTTAPPPPPPPPPSCTVPALRHLTVTAASARLAAAHCSLGGITHTRIVRALVGRIVSQRPAAGQQLAADSKVSVVVGRRR